MSDSDETMRLGTTCPPGDDIMAYVQGELASDERAGIERHCKVCAACMNQLAIISGTIARMKDVPASVKTRDLAPDILARIPARDWANPPLSLRIYVYLPQLVRIAAIILVLLTAGVLIFAKIRADRTGDVQIAAAPHVKAIVQPVTIMPAGRDTAIADGLAWLATTQDSDGSWDAAKWGAKQEHTVGVTALSLLAFLAEDSGPVKNAHAETIDRGVRYLVGQQDAGGRFGPVCDNSMYNHGMATVAILKYLRTDHDQDLKPAADSAVNFICKAQKESGGWSYSSESAREANTSISIWQLQSLMLAESLGRTDLAPRIDRSLVWLRGMVDGSGRMGYSRTGESPDGHDTLTAAGILCLLGRDSSRTKQMIKALEQAVAGQGKTLDYYRWYFLTHALKTSNDDVSKIAVGQLQQTLIAQQSRTGPGAGSWETDDRWSSAGGRIYATSMAVLALE